MTDKSKYVEGDRLAELDLGDDDPVEAMIAGQWKGPFFVQMISPHGDVIVAEEQAGSSTHSLAPVDVRKPVGVVAPA